MRLNSNALASLRFFEATARLLSFTRAGAELGVTSGAVSHQIKYLEDSLGCKLFYRLPKSIKLTEEGQDFASVVVRVMRELDQKATEVVASTRSSVDVRLRTGHSFALGWLVPRLSILRARHPEVTLRVIGAYGYIDPGQRNFDLAVEFRHGEPSGLQSEVLMEEYLVPVCSPEYLAQHAFLKSPSDLARCTLLHDGDAWESASEDAEWRHWLTQVGAFDVDSRQGQFFTLSQMATEGALGHQGVALGRALLIQDLLATGRLVSPFQGHTVKSPCCYSLVYPPEIVDRAGIRAVIEWLREEASTPPKTMAASTGEQPVLNKCGARADAIEGSAYQAA